MGVFSENQPLYAERGIPTFPIMGKRPAIRGFQKIGLFTSSKIVSKFADAAAMGFNVGKQTKITVVDIDSTDERLWQEMIDRFGNAAVKVRTSSGGLHLWYRHNGEGRNVRFEKGLPVDILGAGMVVAPPSRTEKGNYQFLQGDLNDLSRLTPASNTFELRASAHHFGPSDTSPTPKIQVARNKRLFNHLMQEAVHLDDLSDLHDLAFEYADRMIDRNVGHPFTDDEIRSTTESVIKLTSSGKNRFGGKPHLVLYHDKTDRLLKLGSDAIYLYTLLKRWNGDKTTFVVANSLASHMPEGAWTLRRFVAARKALQDDGLIIVLRDATRHAPAEYCWS